MRKQILPFVFAIAIAVTATAQDIPVPQTTGPTLQLTLIDSLRFTKNELGLAVGVFKYNAFAPKWYLEDFGFHISVGAIFKTQINPYKKRIRPSFFRTGINFTDKKIKTIGGNVYEPTAATGKEMGTVLFAGCEKQIFERGIFHIYLGADLATAYFTFNGNVESYDGTKIFNTEKKMVGVGLNPFAEGAIVITRTFKVSIESSFNNWFIHEIDFEKDTVKGDVKQNRVVCSPNPLNAITLSYLF